MGYLLIVVVGIVLVFYFQDRLREQDKTIRELRQHLYNLGQRLASLEGTPPKKPSQEEPPLNFPDKSPEILAATKIAQDKAAAWEKRVRDSNVEPSDPAARTAALWAQAVPLKKRAAAQEPEAGPAVQALIAPGCVESPEKFNHPGADTPGSCADVLGFCAEKPLDDDAWEKVHTPSPAPHEEFRWQTLELFIGRNLLGWAAVIGFVLSAAFFIRYAVKEGWIGPELKVLGIAALGGVFLGIGKYFSTIGWRRFSTMLSSAGIIIVFQAGYASYGFYELISLTWASVVMSLVVLGSFLLAWHYESKLLGLVSIIGGLAVPILLESEVDHYSQFFAYLLILNVGTLVLVNLLHRAPIALFAFLGTQAEFWIWHDANYQPEKLAAVLIFQGLFYAAYLIDTTVAAMVPRQKATYDDACRAVLSPIILFGSLWQLLHDDPIFGDWLGICAFIGAAWYGLLAILYSRHLTRARAGGVGVLAVAPGCAASEKKVEHPGAYTPGSCAEYWKAIPAAATVIALGFVAIGIPLQFSATWIALGWATVFAGLWYCGQRLPNKAFLAMSMVFASLGLVRLISVDFWAFGSIPKEELVRPLLNILTLPTLGVAAVVMLSAVLTNSLLKDRNNDVRIFNGIIGLIGYGILTVSLSIETSQYFLRRMDQFVASSHIVWNFSMQLNVELLASLALTILWTILALVLTETGVVFRSEFLRKASLAGFTLIALKLLKDFSDRMNYTEAIFNPYCFGLIAVGLLWIAVAVQIQCCRRVSKDDRDGFGAVGLAGVGVLFGILSIECYQYFDKHPLQIEPVQAVQEFFRHASLSVLWTVFATILILLGLVSRSAVLRGVGLFGFTLTVGKILVMELFQRPNLTVPLANPYFLTILCPIVPMIALAVWTVRTRPLENRHERDFFTLLGLTGIALLWGASSVECFKYFDVRTDWPNHEFLAYASLTVFWTLLAVVLAIIAGLTNAKSLRVLAVALLLLTLLKVCPIEIWNRPDYVTPLFNPYALPFAFLAFSLIFVCVWFLSTLDEKDSELLGERQAYQFFAFVGVVFLWVSMSAECYESVRLLRGADSGAWQAQMGLSILWSVFGGVLIFVGFVWRSAVLRWMAIVLFALTSTKVLIVDMAGVNELYRIGAFFVLAVILTLAAWAYQRFKPEDNKSRNGVGTPT